MHFSYLKIEIYVPETHFAALQDSLRSVDAGHFGNYDSCLSYGRVVGVWRPLDGANPYIGSQNEISNTPEVKIEVTIKKDSLDTVMKAIKEAHPYEVPIVNVIPLYATGMDY